MADPVSLGNAIGIQGRFDNQSFDMFTTGMARLDAQAKARAAGKEKEETKQDEIIKSVKVPGVHRLDEQAGKEILAGFLAKVQKAKIEHPNNASNYFMEDASRAQQEFAQLVVRKARIDEIEKSIKDQIAAGLETQNDLELHKAIEEGSYDDIAKIKPDGWGTVSFNSDTRDIGYKGIPIVNTMDLEGKHINDPDFKSGLSTVQDKEYTTKGGKILTDYKYAPRTKAEAEELRTSMKAPGAIPSLESAGESLDTTPGYSIAKALQLVKAKKLSPEWVYEQDPIKKAAAYRQAQIEDLASRSGFSLSKRAYEPNAPTEGDGDKKKKTMEGVTLVQTISPTDVFVTTNVDLQQKTGLPIVDSVKATGGSSNAYIFRSLDNPLEMPTPTLVGTLDGNSGKKMNDANVGKSSKVTNLLVKAFNKDTGNEVTSDKEEELVLKGKVEYRPTVAAVAGNVVEKFDTEGNSTGTETAYTQNIYAPMKAYADPLKAKGYDVDAYVKEAARLNKEAKDKFEQAKGNMRGPVKTGGAKTETKPATTKTDWSKYKR